MQFLTTISLIALSAVLQPATAKCYGSGDNWNNQAAAREWVRHACADQGGMFTGFYDRLQSKEMCVEGNFFQVKNENANESFDLADGDCIQRLYNEIRMLVKRLDSLVRNRIRRSHHPYCNS